jgi:hypothetical protein
MNGFYNIANAPKTAEMWACNLIQKQQRKPGGHQSHWQGAKKLDVV